MAPREKDVLRWRLKITVLACVTLLAAQACADENEDSAETRVGEFTYIAPPATDAAQAAAAAEAAQTADATQAAGHMGGTNFAASDSQSVAEIEGVSEGGDGASKKFGMHYYAIFYGPALKNPTGYQPTPTGGIDPAHPVQIKNFLGATYNLSDKFAITPTAFWLWRPVMGQRLTLQDPFLRLSDNQVFSTGDLNLYADVRFHFPVTTQSRNMDMLLGLQSFQALTYLPQGSRFSAALYSSVRYNRFGKRGTGNDVELYLAPNMAYLIGAGVSMTLLYEIGASHVFGAPKGLDSDGTDLEPGLSWEVTPNLLVNPYINLYPGNTMSLKTSSFGMTLSWTLL